MCPAAGFRNLAEPPSAASVPAPPRARPHIELLPAMPIELTPERLLLRRRAAYALTFLGSWAFAAPLMLWMQTDRVFAGATDPVERILTLVMVCLVGSLMGMVGAWSLASDPAVPRPLILGLAWPVPGLLLAAVLAGRAGVPPLVLWTLLVVPAAALIAYGWTRTGPGTSDRWRLAAFAGPLTLAFALAAVTGVGLIWMGAGAYAWESATAADFPRVGRNFAQVEALRAYRLPADPAVTPAQAGEALNALARVGDTTFTEPSLRRPARLYPQPWVVDTANPLGLEPRAWPSELIPRAAAGLTPAQSAYLRSIAEHPAAAELRLTARAARADVTGSLYTLPFADDVTAYTLGPPRLGGLLYAGHVQVAAAALDVAENRRDRAEERLREVISTGFLLRDEAVELVPALYGVRLARHGGTALASLYRVSGRDQEASRILAGLAAEAPAAVPAARAFHAESAMVAQSDGCGSLHQVLYGRKPGTAEALARHRQAAVRYPSDAAVFQVIEETPRRMAGAPTRDMDWPLRFTIRLLGTGARQQCPRAVATLRTAAP